MEVVKCSRLLLAHTSGFQGRRPEVAVGSSPNKTVSAG